MDGQILKNENSSHNFTICVDCEDVKWVRKYFQKKFKTQGKWFDEDVFKESLQI